MEADVKTPSFDDLETFCLFVGYTRSGHSLVGTFLDAHPEAAIAHEQPLFSRSFRRPTTGEVQHPDRTALFEKLVADTRYRVELGRRGSRRTVDSPMPLVPGGSHGEVTTLRMIGTKRGQEAPVAWTLNPDILDQLRAFVEVPLRLVHVYRNPWDNIASMARQSGERAIVRYFHRARAIAEMKEKGLPIHDLALEDLIADPKAEIAALLRYCGLDAGDDYLAACASILDGEPHPSRHDREWSDWEIRAVVHRLEGIPWLDRYPRTPFEPPTPEPGSSA